MRFQGIRKSHYRCRIARHDGIRLYGPRDHRTGIDHPILAYGDAAAKSGMSPNFAAAPQDDGIVHHAPGARIAVRRKSSMVGNVNLILNDRPCADVGRTSDYYSVPNDHISPDEDMRSDHAILAHFYFVSDVGERLYTRVGADVVTFTQRGGMDRELPHDY